MGIFFMGLIVCISLISIVFANRTMPATPIMGGAPPKASRRRNKDAELQDGCRLE